MEGYRIDLTNCRTKKKSTKYIQSASYGTFSLGNGTFYKATIKGYITLNKKKYYGPSKTVYIAQQPKASAKLYKQVNAKITWNKVTGAKNYTVYVSTTGKTSGYKKKVTTKSRTYILKNMTKGKNYYVYIKANYKGGGSTLRSACLQLRRY